MPTYEYACASCGHQWEDVQRITEPPIEVCPKCSKSSAHRLISATNFILKGGGWYSDLYSSAKSPSKKAEDSSSTTDAGTGKSESTKSESPKSETKAASTTTS
jgi:putative FmdB family regulatory protein